MTTALATLTFDEMTRLSESIAKSGLFGMKTADQALALMAISAAEGIHPALAARDYHIIQGRPTLKADAMLSRFQSAGGKMEMLEYTDAKVSAKFFHPQGGSVTVDWDIERAKRAGLTSKDVWKQYPRNMLRARVISEGVRTVFPGATAGLLAPEEAMDLGPPTERDITPDKPLKGVAALRERVVAALDGEAISTLDESTGEVTHLGDPRTDIDAAFITPDQVIYLSDLMSEHAIKVDKFLEKAAIKSLSFLPADQYDHARQWIDAVIENRRKTA